MATRTPLVFLAVLAHLVSIPALSFGLDKVRVGLTAVTALFGPVWVSEEKGLFKKHGVESEVIVIGGGAARGVSALIAGDIQFLVGSGDVVINTSLKGMDTVIAASLLNKGVQRVMAKPELKTPADLKGKRVGITRFGSASHLVLQMMQRKWGMGPGEIQVVQVGSSAAMLASLDKGGIDAAVLSMPFIFVAEDRGYRILADLGDMDIDFINTMLDTTRTYLRTHRSQATGFMKGFVEGIAYFKKNKKESLEVLRKKLRTDAGGEKDLERSYDILASKYYDKVPYPSLVGTETVLEFLARENPKAKGANPKSFIDDSIIRELDSSGFIKALYEK